MEAVGRSEFIRPGVDDRDPISATVFYLALRKKHIVLTFWKQSSGHADQRSMLKFMSNDFAEPRWKSAALKNAFALMSKRRFRTSWPSILVKMVHSHSSLHSLCCSLLLARRQSQGRSQRLFAPIGRFPASNCYLPSLRWRLFSCPQDGPGRSRLAPCVQQWVPLVGELDFLDARQTRFGDSGRYRESADKSLTVSTESLIVRAASDTHGHSGSSIALQARQDWQPHTRGSESHCTFLAVAQQVLADCQRCCLDTWQCRV